ncbi:hypothetical protein DFP72DRAFT_1054000 [Ephemerocybe angulata]|uniref:Uncharacterized protein n=1 Tax=Ephemerocybe angulata TaxID=980116 RepID=A0A8H6LVA0_9AGAR|nr:hypothetical protein DFP72DRAFT_1054000 [Tulosesus angulatus]
MPATDATNGSISICPHCPKILKSQVLNWDNWYSERRSGACSLTTTTLNMAALDLSVHFAKFSFHSGFLSGYLVCMSLLLDVCLLGVSRRKLQDGVGAVTITYGNEQYTGQRVYVRAKGSVYLWRSQGQSTGGLDGCGREYLDDDP